MAAWIGPAIAAAGSVIGGLISRKGQSDANAQNEQLQREFAQNGIRWKVEDAKAAGLHPLYALGGSGASYTPAAQNVMADMGQNVSRAAAAFQGVGDADIRAAQLEAIKAATKKDYALASAAESEAARTRQQSLPVVPNPADVEWYDAKGMGNPYVAQSFPVHLGSDAVTQKLGPPTPDYLTSDTKPGFQRYNTALAGEVILPAGGSMSEAIESLENPVLQAWVLAENVKHYGPGAERKLKALLGDRYKWWTNPAGAVGDAVRSFGRGVTQWGGN